MKKVIALIFFGVCGYCSFGQAVNVTILAGPNVSTFVPGGNSPEATAYIYGLSSSPGWGFHAGVFAEFSFGRVAIEPGLLYQSIASNINNIIGFGFGDATTAESFSVQYLQVPLNILYYIPFKTGKYFLGGGPYVAFGLSGTVTTTYPPTANFNPVSGKYIFSSSDNPDYGFNLVAGVHVQGNFIFSFGYGKGFRTEIPHSVYSFSIGHTIW